MDEAPISRGFRSRRPEQNPQGRVPLLQLDNGDPLAVTFADYLMPMLSDVPGIETLITEDAPSPLNPLGLKGAGEAGVNAVGAAIAGAIDDAIEVPGAVTRLPVTPQRLREILRRRE